MQDKKAVKPDAALKAIETAQRIQGKHAAGIEVSKDSDGAAEMAFRDAAAFIKGRIQQPADAALQKHAIDNGVKEELKALYREGRIDHRYRSAYAGAKDLSTKAIELTKKRGATLFDRGRASGDKVLKRLAHWFAEVDKNK
jgi:hypothetical protein